MWGEEKILKEMSVQNTLQDFNERKIKKVIIGTWNLSFINCF